MFGLDCVGFMCRIHIIVYMQTVQSDMGAWEDVSGA